MGKRKGLGIKRTVRKITNGIRVVEKPIVGAVVSTENSIKRTLKSMFPKRKKAATGDTIPSVPGRRHQSSLGSEEPVQKSHVITLYKPIKGIGYLPPGSLFDLRPRILKHDFAFDMQSSIRTRSYATTYWRHSGSGYTDADATCLSPALVTGGRAFEGVTLNTSVRAGVVTGGLFSSTSLFDLELASWNANPMKLVQDPSSNFGTDGSPAISSLQVWKDHIPDADHNKWTPFPVSANTINVKLRPPFMVNLGPGSVKFTVQNRVPTNAELEFVIFQQRDDFSVDPSTTLGAQIIAYSNTSTINKLKGPLLTTQSSGSGGLDYVSGDSTADPDYKFLGSYPKFMDTRAPGIERHRVKVVLGGGALKTFTFNLPAVIYDSNKNRGSGLNPFASGTPSDASVTSLQTYVIFLALNGSLMPVFTAPIANGTNDIGTGVDYVNLTAVDRQCSPASILVTGCYTEHPKACYATSQTREYNNFPHLQNVALIAGTGSSYSANTHTLVSGYVNPGMPSATASGNITAFGQLGGATASTKQDEIDG